MPRSATAFRLEPPSETEHELQVSCTNMLERILLPEVIWTAVDHAHSLNMQIGRNGRPIGLLEAQKRKARGVKPGIADYLFWHYEASFAIEMKRSADDDLSDDQKKFLGGLLKLRHQVAVCWSWQQVFNKVSGWGLTRPGTRIAA